MLYSASVCWQNHPVSHRNHINWFTTNILCSSMDNDREWIIPQIYAIYSRWCTKLCLVPSISHSPQIYWGLPAIHIILTQVNDFTRAMVSWRWQGNTPIHNIIHCGPISMKHQSVFSQNSQQITTDTPYLAHVIEAPDVNSQFKFWSMF